MENAVQSLDGGGVFCEPCALAIGIFDAVHKGHQHVLNAAKDFAAKNGAKAFVLTFYPHPSKVLGGEKAGGCPLIYPADVRAELLLDFGMDGVFFKDFTPEFASKTPEEFFGFLMEKFPNLKCVATGENFRFGVRASADVKVLKELAGGSGVETISVCGVLDGGNFVSSTRLRKALQDGDMQSFYEMSGRNYFCRGRVEGGRKLGRTIGFPTLNLKAFGECKPKFGVYASRLQNLDTKEIFCGVSNVGVNPTVGECAPVLETNTFDFPDFGEGANIKVELLKFLRGEKKFASINELKAQIAVDKENANKFFRVCGC